MEKTTKIQKRTVFNAWLNGRAIQVWETNDPDKSKLGWQDYDPEKGAPAFLPEQIWRVAAEEWTTNPLEAIDCPPIMWLLSDSGMDAWLVTAKSDESVCGCYGLKTFKVLMEKKYHYSEDCINWRPCCK